jgi:hypothetical protein
MLLVGAELRHVIDQTSNRIELRNEYGRLQRTITKTEALALDLDLFVGIGNRRRVRFLRLRSQTSLLNAGSRNTKRITDRGGKNIAHPLIREHRSIRGEEK